MRKVLFGTVELTIKEKEFNVGDTVELIGVTGSSFEDVKPQRKHDYAVVTTFPSVDTRVCNMQVLRLIQIAEQYPNFDYISFSLDLPAALTSYSSEHPVGKIQMFTDYKNRTISTKLGLLIDEIKLFNRCLFVLDNNNKVVYKQVNTQVREEVDFEALTNFLSTL